MSIELFKAKIAQEMKRKGVDPDFNRIAHEYFINAALSIDNEYDASRFYEGSLEFDAEQQGMKVYDDIIDGVQTLILYAINGIEDAEEITKRRKMWHDIFGTFDDLIKQKEIING